MARKQPKLTGVFYNDKGKTFQQITEELFNVHIKSQRHEEKKNASQ